MVEKSTNFNSRWVRASKAGIPDTTVTLSDLVEGTSYEFRVYAENEAGTGPPSKPCGPVEAKEPHGKRRIKCTMNLSLRDAYKLKCCLINFCLNFTWMNRNLIKYKICLYNKLKATVGTNTNFGKILF